MSAPAERVVPQAEVVVDLDAIAANTAVLRERVGRPLMAVVKADGYGHGLVPAARAVLAGGADSLVVRIRGAAVRTRSLASSLTYPSLPGGAPEPLAPGRSPRAVAARGHRR